MKTVVKVLLLLVIAILLAIWSPWNSWDLSFTSLLGYVPPTQYSGLKVTSLAGEIQVYIDDQLVGAVTPTDSPLELFQIDSGSRRIKLYRESDPPGFYKELNTVIEFVPGVDVVVGYEIGPNKEFSEGHILSARSKLVDSPVKLDFVVNPEDASVFVDDLPVPNNVILDLDLLTQHTVKVTANGYETLQFIILPENQQDRDRLKAYDLRLEINLMMIPLDTTIN